MLSRASPPISEGYSAGGRKGVTRDAVVSRGDAATKVADMEGADDRCPIDGGGWTVPLATVRFIISFSIVSRYTCPFRFKM
jgi:hypothetical protein